MLLVVGSPTAVGGPDHLSRRSFAGVVVGVGISLVLDEFALIRQLQDVYWSGEGQLCVEAVCLTGACMLLMLVGFGASGLLAIDGSSARSRASTAAANDRRWRPVQTGREDFIGGRPSTS